MTNENKTIVIDNGSSSIKVGFAGHYNRFPSIFPSLAGNPKSGLRNYRGRIFNQYDTYVCDEAYDMAGVLVLKYPIEHGIITNWSLMTEIYNCINRYYKFDEHPVLLTEASMNPKFNRERLSQIMFEQYNVPSLYLALRPSLSLYSSGRTTGIVLESGDAVSQIVPVYEGFHFPRAIIRLNFAGRDITYYLQRLLMEEGIFLCNTFGEKEIVRDIKESLGYVALDYEAEFRNHYPDYYEITKGHYNGNLQGVPIDEQSFRCLELLFKPDMLNLKYDSIDRAIFKSIEMCGKDLHKDLYGNIVLSGGTTMFRGLPERIEKEIIRFAPSTMEVNVVASPERKYAAWIGGSILGALPTFQQMVVTHKEYNDAGVGIVHRKCLI